jgi:hypothetical protein
MEVLNKMRAEIDKFILGEEKNFPPFMMAEELKKYNHEGKLHPIIFSDQLVGFFVLDKEKFKSLYVCPEAREWSSEIIPGVYQYIKILSNGYLTIAADPNNPKTIKNASRNGFVCTGRKVQGKDRELEIWEWKTETKKD